MASPARVDLRMWLLDRGVIAGCCHDWVIGETRELGRMADFPPQAREISMTPVRGMGPGPPEERKSFHPQPISKGVPKAKQGTCFNFFHDVA